MSQKLLLSAEDLRIILFRLACQLKETHGNFDQTLLVGLQPRGVRLAERLCYILTRTDLYSKFYCIVTNLWRV